MSPARIHTARRPQTRTAHASTSTTLEDIETGEEVDIDLAGEVTPYVPASGVNVPADYAHDAEGGEVESFVASIGNRPLSEEYLRVRFGRTEEDLMTVLLEAADEPDDYDYSDDERDRQRDARRHGED